MKKMLNDNILVKVEKNENVLSSGLIVNNLDRNYTKVKIIMLPDNKFDQLENGDIVYISKYAGTEITLDEKEYLIIQGNDIILKL